MEETPIPHAIPPGLKFLKLLVTVLTGTMIAGLVAVIWLLVIRLPAAMQSPLSLPDSIDLPAGARAIAFTAAPGWYGVVTSEQQILIFDSATGSLRQTVRIAP